MEVRIEIGKLVRQDVAVGKYIESLFAKPFLHFDDVFA